MLGQCNLGWGNKAMGQHNLHLLAICLFLVKSVPKTLSKKLYLQLNLTQIVHSNSKMLSV